MRIRHDIGVQGDLIARTRSNRPSRNLQCGKFPTSVGVMGALLIALALAVPALAQNADSAGVDGSRPVLVQPVEQGQAGPHVTITLQDAVDLAQKNDAPY